MNEQVSNSVLALHIGTHNVLSGSAVSSRSPTPSTVKPSTLEAHLSSPQLHLATHGLVSSSLCLEKDGDLQIRSNNTGLIIAAPTSYVPSRLAHSRPLLAHELADMLREDFETPCMEGATMPLAEMAQLLRSQHDLERRCSRLNSRLYQSRRLQALAARLKRVATYTRRALVESLRMADQSTFASIYYDFQDLWNAFNDLRRRQSEGLNHEEPIKAFSSFLDPTQTSPSFLNAIALDLRKDLTDFLVKVRTDPGFVASRICRLSPQSLSALTTTHGIQAVAQPVFGFMSPRSDRSPRKTFSKSVEIKEYLSGFESQDPFSALLFMPFAAPTDLNSSEDCLRTELAATICSKLILHSRPGADQFIFKVLDTWADLWDWPGKKKLELYLLQVLNDGEAIFGDTTSEPDTGLPSTLEKALEAFLEISTVKFFDLIAAHVSYIELPVGIRAISKAIHDKLGPFPKRQSSVLFMIIHKWLFGQFLHRAIAYPESCSLLLQVHITDRARTRLLLGIADRVLKHSLGTSFYSTQTESLQQSIHKAFKNVAVWIDESRMGGRDLLSRKPNLSQDISTQFLMICPSDVITLARTLFPYAFNIPMLVLEQLEQMDATTSISAPSPRSIPSPSTSIFGDGSSILSKSASSLTSLSTHREFYQDDLDDDRPDYDIVSVGLTGVDEAISVSAYGQKLKRACDALNAITGIRDDSLIIDACWDILTIVSDPAQLRLESPMTCSPDHTTLDNQLDQQLPSTLVEISVSKVLRDYDLPDHVIPNHFRQNRSYRSIEKLFQDAINFHQDTSEYWAAQRLSIHLRAFQDHFSNSKEKDACDRMIDRIRDQTVGEMNTSNAEMTKLAKLLGQLDDSKLVKVISHELMALDALRSKIWYLTDVRTSRSYEDASAIANALRMIRLQKNKTKSLASMRQRNNSKSPGNASQIADIITAVSNQGGYEKLNDDQVDIVKKWIRQTSIDISYCAGEEIVHRLNLEISRCITKLVGSNVLESPVLWTSELFRREREIFDVSMRKSSNSATVLTPAIQPYATDSFGFKSRFSTRNQDQDKANATSDIFWSPRKSAVTGGSINNFDARISPPRKVITTSRQNATPKKTQVFLTSLRQALTGYFFSDLVSLVFPRGSETDEWMASELVQASAKDRQQPQYQNMQMLNSPMNFVTGEMVKDDRVVPHNDQKPMEALSELHDDKSSSEQLFDSEAAYGHFLFIFDHHPDPYKKLNALKDIERMAVASEFGYSTIPDGRSVAPEKVMRRLLQTPDTRPKNLFRNLQYLVSLISEPLDRSIQFTAFQVFAQAALDLKQDVCQSLILTADQIVAFHTQNRRPHPPLQALSLIPNSLLPPAPHDTMAAAAKLWLITAKEGHAIAQRELATFYLTHPELLPRAMLPLTPPRRVFQPEQIQRQTDLDPARSDPYTMCVALHWMEESARGGDALAQGYLRDREELGAIP